jgi:fluoride exporter
MWRNNAAEWPAHASTGAGAHCGMTMAWPASGHAGILGMEEIEGDGVRRNRPQGMMTPGRRVAPRSFFSGAGRRAESRTAVRILLLIIFGALGTLARYGLQGLVQYRAGSDFPWGTLAVNLSGCLLLGAVGQFALNHLSVAPDWRVAITVGFFGAFTTFSSFGWETIRLAQDGEWGRAALYVAASVAGGLFLVAAGMRIGNAI